MMYIKIDRKDIETHWNTPYHEICMSGAPSLHKGGLRAPGGPKNCDFIKYDEI